LLETLVFFTGAQDNQQPRPGTARFNDYPEREYAASDWRRKWQGS